MTRPPIPICELPDHVQQRVRAQAKDERSVLDVATGKSRRRKRDPGPEHAEQVAVVEWAAEARTLAEFPELDALYAIPNESFGRKDGAEKKARGRRAGMPDLCLPVPRRTADNGVYGACYIEMKALSGSVQQSQRDRIALLRARGNFVEVCLSATAAQITLRYYLTLPKP